MSARKWVLIVGVFVVLALSVSAAFAQTATPIPPLSVDDVFSGANDLIATYGLAALIAVAAFIGAAALIIRRMRRAAG